MTNLHELDAALERVVEPEEEQEVLLHRQQLSKLHNTEDDIKSRITFLGSEKESTDHGLTTYIDTKEERHSSKKIDL
jgi:hypothetical protein